MMRQILSLSLLLSALSNCQSPAPTSETTDAWTLLVGTYTRQEAHVNGQAKGIYQFRVAPNGHLSRKQLIADDIPNPSYLTLSPDGNLLFAVSEIGADLDSVGYLHLYQRDDQGQWQFINQQPTHALAPCYVAVHPSGKSVAVANYLGGTIALYPIQKAPAIGPASSIQTFSGGSPHPRQDSSHPHATVFSPDGNYLFVPDLGSNKVWCFQLDTNTWQLQPTEQVALELPAASGPRHLVFHPNGQLAYLANELSNTVTALRIKDGYFLEVIAHYSTLPQGVQLDNYVADIHLNASGTQLYVSNRGHNTIAHFTVNPVNGQLEPQAYHAVQGDFPRNFIIHPNDQWLYVANQNSNNISIFAISEAGDLNFRSAVEVPTPVCLQFRTAP